MLSFWIYEGLEMFVAFVKFCVAYLEAVVVSWLGGLSVGIFAVFVANVAALCCCFAELYWYCFVHYILSRFIWSSYSVVVTTISISVITVVSPVFLLLLFLLLLLLCLFLVSSLFTSSSLVLTSRSISLFQLFSLQSFLLIELFNFFSGHSEIASSSSESSWPPAENGSSSFIVDNNFGAINFAVAGIFVCCCKIIFGVELNKAIASGFALKIANNSYRFDDAVFLQL